MSFRTAVFASLTATSLFLVGCVEQQVLYTAESPSVIPNTPGSPSDPVAHSPADAFANRDTASISEQAGAPVPVEFRPQVLNEPVSLAVVTGVVIEKPVRYLRAAPGGSFRAAEWSVPDRANPMRQGELIAFHFGVGQGGSVDDNLTRWAGQFRPGPDGLRPLRRFEVGEVGGFRVTRMTLKGTFAPGSLMPGSSPPPPQEDWGMDALIVEGPPEGTLFLRMSGPYDLLEAESSVMEHMAARLRLATGREETEEVPVASEQARPITAPTEQALVDAGPVRFVVPSTWQNVPVRSSMRALELSIPPDRGNRPAEFVVFTFQGADGGSAEENILRWIGQMSQPDGTRSMDRARVRTAQVGTLTVTRLDIEGTYSGSAIAPMGPPPSPQPETRMVGLIVEGAPRGTVFIRITGPIPDVRILDPAIDTMIQSFEVNE